MGPKKLDALMIYVRKLEAAQLAFEEVVFPARVKLMEAREKAQRAYDRVPYNK